MRATAQEEQLRAGLFDIARLVEPPIVDGEDLIATDDNCTRMPARDNLSFFLCERLRGRDRITARTPRRRLDPRLVDKRWADLEQARSQLLLLRGRAHELATAACVMRDGIPLWQNESVPRLTMRPFSEAFLDNYLREEGDSLLACVGAY